MPQAYPNPASMRSGQSSGMSRRPYDALDFYIYELDFTSVIATGASVTGQLTIQADSDFLLSKLAYSQVSAAGSPIPSILIQDTGSGRNLMNNAVPVPDFFGTGALPFILPHQRIFKANATINITVTNTDNTNAINKLYLSFIGEKGFYYS